MATMLDIITRAYRKTGIAGIGEDLEPEYIAEGLVALNSMLHQWKLRSVDIEHTDLSTSGIFPIGPEFEEGTVYLLASRIAPDYQRPAAFDADDFFRAMQAAYLVIEEVDLLDGLTLARRRVHGDGVI